MLIKKAHNSGPGEITVPWIIRARKYHPQLLPSLCTFCFVSHRFPLTIIHIGIRRLLQLVTGFVGRSATRRLLFLVHSCLPNTSLAAGQCAREAAGHPTSYLKWYLI